MSKIKVDPRTFKIINQEKTHDSKSDSESSTSLYSDSESDSIKVIKLDDSEQSGGRNFQDKKQNMQPQQVQPVQHVQPVQPVNQQKFQEPQLQQQPLQQQPVQKPVLITNSNEPQLQNTQIKNVESYLRNNSGSESLEETNTSELELTESTEASEIKEQIPEQTQTQNQKFEEKNTADIIDLTKSQLHDVLHSIFTDVAGDSISENIGKMSKLLETHNQIMEKILNQLIIMNSNYKQITVPEAIQTNTKQAKDMNDFRRNIEKLEKN